jgi:hypothetical protein
MMTIRRVSDGLLSLGTGPIAVAGLAIFLLFGALVLPGQAAAAEKVAGGAGSPDTSLFYSSERLVQLAEGYGEAGRAAYVRARWTFDLAFPLVYGFFLLTSIGWALRRGVAPASPWRVLILVPVAAVAFDFLENTATSLVMARYPADVPLAATLAPGLTLIKWALVYGSFAVLVVAVVAALWKQIHRPPRPRMPG